MTQTERGLLTVLVAFQVALCMAKMVLPELSWWVVTAPAMVAAGWVCIYALASFLFTVVALELNRRRIEDRPRTVYDGYPRMVQK